MPLDRPKVSGDEGEIGLLNGATLVNSVTGSMEWSAPLAVGWGGTLRNKGELTFAGAVSFEVAPDGAGFLGDNAGAWPVVINEDGADVILETESDVHLEWLFWNAGGVLVST